MNIPEALQHFPEPALIVVCDHEQVRFLLAFEDSLEEVESLEMPKDALSDNEGKEIGQELSDEERMHRFARVIGMRASQFIRDEDAATTLHLIAPPDIAHLIKKELAPEAANILAKEIHANVMKEDEVQLLERLAAA